MSPPIPHTPPSERRRYRWRRPLRGLTVGILVAVAVGLLAAASAASSPPTTLYDQNNNTPDLGTKSGSDGGPVLADDFVVPSGPAWHITSVSVTGLDDGARTTVVTVVIYSDASGSPGTQVYQDTTSTFTDALTPYPSGAAGAGGDLTIPIDATLGPGHYWLSVQGDPKWFWVGRSPVLNHSAMYKGGNACPSDWGDWAACVWSGTAAPGTLDAQFSLTGTAVDATAPVTTIAFDPAAPNGSNGWYTNSVGVTVSASDHGSGVAETRCVLDPASVPVSFDDLPSGPCTLSNMSGDGPHTLYAASKDNQGNIESPVISQPLQIDSTQPSLSPTVSPNPLYLHATGASVSANASDQTSGIDQSSVSCGAVDTSTLGDHTVTCSASDQAGNQASKTIHYTVEDNPYSVLGFFSPVPGSKWKVGQTVPVKFALADVNGVRISDAAAAALLSPTCRVKFSASGAQTLNATCVKYDPATHQFLFNWKLGGTTGSETIKVTITYPGTTTTTTKTESIAITK